MIPLDPIYASTGSLRNPSYGFADRVGNGFALLSTDVVGLVSSGSARFRVSPTGASFLNQVRGNNGSATQPTWSFTNDTTLGIYRYAANTIGFAAAGSAVFLIDNNGPVFTTPVHAAINDDPGICDYSFYGISNCGMRYDSPSTSLMLVVGGGDVANIDTSNNFVLLNAGGGFKIKEGTNACMGTGQLVAGTLVVPTTQVAANSRIFLTVQSLGTVSKPQSLGVTARTAGTSFTVTSFDNTDTSVFAWEIKNPS